jgi:hypothetical protein
VTHRHMSNLRKKIRKAEKKGWEKKAERLKDEVSRLSKLAAQSTRTVGSYGRSERIKQRVYQPLLGVNSVARGCLL